MGLTRDAGFGPTNGLCLTLTMVLEVVAMEISAAIGGGSAAAEEDFGGG